MCDYSLHLFPNRLANEGEELIVHRFGGASLGLASVCDFTRPAARCDAGSSKPWTWARAKEWLKNQQTKFDAPKRVPAVCVPPGASLLLRDIPKGIQREFAVKETEEVRFVQTSAEVNTYRDAVRFSNGRQIMLQSLREGQRAIVLSMGATPEVSPVTEAILQRAGR